MRVVIAPDSFGSSLASAEAAGAIAEGWARGAPHDVLQLVPLSDGGPGLVDALAATLTRAGAGSSDPPAGMPLGRVHATVTSDPLGRRVPGAVLLVEDGDRRTAWVEASQATGLHLLGPEERDPTRTTTFGVGALLDAALELEPHCVVLGLGGSGTNDAGAGLLAALGVGARSRLGMGGLALAATTPADLEGLAAVSERLGGVELVGAYDDDGPLLGLRGTSAVHAVTKGADEEQAQALEGSLGHLASVVARAHPPRRDLLSDSAMRPERVAGTAAGGGLGYAILLLGGRLASGAALAVEATRLDQRLACADLVVTGEDHLDWQSLRGSVVSEVAGSAARHGIAAVVLAGQVLVGRREAMAAGFSGVYAVADRVGEVPAALADPAGTLSARAARVARTWSPA